MQDVVFDDRRQFSAKAVAREQSETPRRRKRKRGFFCYIVDWLERAIIISALLCISFTLFASSGSYSMLSPVLPQPKIEVAYIMIGIVACSTVLMYLVSFSRFLQNFITALVLGIFVLSILNQYALFDKSSILLNSLGGMLGTEVDTILNGYSHYIIAGLVALIFLLFISISSRITMFYFTSILVFILGGLISDIYLNRRQNNNFNVTYEQKALKNDESYGKKFVFIALPNLTSYNNLKDFVAEKAIIPAYNDKINKTLDVMLGFYVQNKFSVYPNAYTKEEDAFVNLTQMLNPNNLKENPRGDILNSVAMRGYWNFKSLNNNKIYLKNNQIFENFRKNKYDLKAYQSRGIELCSINNEMVVGKCVQKSNIPMSFANAKFTTLQKTVLLFNQWIESTNLLPSYSPIYNGIRMLNNMLDLPSTGFSSKDLYVSDALETFDILTDDIKKDTNDTAYFAFIDMPSNLYIYDQYCTLKPISQWVSKDNIPGLIPADNFKKREAYAEQLSCLYGRLENFMQDLAKNKKLDNTVVILQGISGTKALSPASSDFYTQMKSVRQVTTAIFDPLKSEFNNDEKVCQAAAILKGYIFKTGECVELDDANLSDKTHKELLNKFKKDHVANDKIFSSQTNFINWYQGWADANSVDNNAFSSSQKPLPTIVDTEVKKAPKATPAKQQKAEAENLSLTKAMSKNPEPASKSMPLVEPKKTPQKLEDKVKKVESLKASAKTTPKAVVEKKVNIKAKVIDRKADIIPHDVLPPFVAE